MYSLPMGAPEGKSEMLGEANEGESEEKRCPRLLNLLHYLLVASLSLKTPGSCKNKNYSDISDLSTIGKGFVFSSQPTFITSLLLLTLKRKVVFGKTVIDKWLFIKVYYKRKALLIRKTPSWCSTVNNFKYDEWFFRSGIP